MGRDLHLIYILYNFGKAVRTTSQKNVLVNLLIQQKLLEQF